MRHVPHLLCLVLAMGALAPRTDAQRRPSRSERDLRSFVHEGRERTFVVRAPRSVASTTEPMPLVIVLHGGGGNAANAERMTGFTSLVERERIVVAYPNGTGRSTTRLLTWNAGHCCGLAMQQRVDDVGFVDTMIDILAREMPIDSTRIYLTGMSNGAMMTHRLAREMRHRPAAIAPVVGAVFGDETAARGPVSVLAFNGLKDESVPTDGGTGSGIGRRAWDGVPPRPNEAQGQYWARENRCDTTPRVTSLDRLVHWVWSCPDGRAVELYQVTDGGHAWPGGNPGTRRADRPSGAIDATTTMWAFFRAHPRR